jgi:hypothetical protein
MRMIARLYNSRTIRAGRFSYPSNRSVETTTGFPLPGPLKNPKPPEKLRRVLLPSKAGSVTRRPRKWLRAGHNHDFVAVKTCPNTNIYLKALSKPQGFRSTGFRLEFTPHPDAGPE